MTLERQRKTSQYVKRILSPPSKEPQVNCQTFPRDVFFVFSFFLLSIFKRSYPLNATLVWWYSFQLTYSCSETWTESCINWSGGLWEVSTRHQNPVKVILSTKKIMYIDYRFTLSPEKYKSMTLFRRYIPEYCPVLEGIYTRVLNVSGLEVSNIFYQLSQVSLALL